MLAAAEVFGRGKSWYNNFVVGLIRFSGIIFPGKGVLVKPVPAALGTVSVGSLMFPARLVKLPCRKASLSRDSTMVPAPEFWRVPCQLPKMNVLFFLIGPPSVAPY